ncbi:UNVERIFIED_CONTAM: hypothetical protein Sangu_3243300 [Sesamum angustifolium]|uniref:Uncharacterized protein n=1 Tax=Sesamum angustifolium TaxID=2727405 RepID=A0AAW2JG10_9LAMI
MTTGTTKTKERLDRIVLHKNGFLSFLEQRTVEQRELAHGSSKKKLKLEAMWVKSDECEEVIRQQWDLDADGNAAHRVWEKVKACRVGLINWSKSAFGNNLAFALLDAPIELAMGQSQNSYPPKSHRTRGPGRNQSSPKPGARTGARKQALNSHSINRKATTDKLFEEEKEERKRTSLVVHLDLHPSPPQN